MGVDPNILLDAEPDYEIELGQALARYHEAFARIQELPEQIRNARANNRNAEYISLMEFEISLRREIRILDHNIR